MDTTSTGYQIGYTIGAYLPVIVLLFLAVLILWKGYSRKKDQNTELP